jgi:hypothetical protein
MNTKTLLLSIACFWSGITTLSAQTNQDQATESLDQESSNTNSQIELTCDHCEQITEIWLKGEGTSYSASYQGESWKEIFPKKIPVGSGDFTVRVKLNGKTWKTLHLYIQKNKKERLVLN